MKVPAGLNLNFIRLLYIVDLQTPYSSDLEVSEHGESKFHGIKAPFSMLDDVSDQTAVFLDAGSAECLDNEKSVLQGGLWGGSRHALWPRISPFLMKFKMANKQHPTP